MENVDVELGDVNTIQSTVQSLLDCVENKKIYTNKLPPCIYMVPSVFRDLTPISFSPRVVSIGPLHSEDNKLQEFEVYKASSVHKLLHRLDSPPEQTLKACAEKVNASIDRIRECYAGMKNYSDVELAKMMVMDACFILEFIYSFSSDRSVVKNQLLQHHVIYDLVLLENQIPFFVLNDIFQCTILTMGDEPLLSTFVFPVLQFLHLFAEDLDIRKIGKSSPHDHILGLLHNCYWPRGIIVSPKFSSSSNHSAVDLDRAGVSFKPNKHAKWPLAMEVKLHRIPYLYCHWAKPTLSMPVLKIHDYTELILRNLMAYEQCSLGVKFVTSYVAVMDRLVNTEEDIALLEESKVLVNMIGSNCEAANMINSICREVAWNDFFYNKQWKKLDSYYNDNWPKHVAWLRRTYFSSPWNIIALVAGFVLFGLTVVQTVFAIKTGAP